MAADRPDRMVHEQMLAAQTAHRVFRSLRCDRCANHIRDRHRSGAQAFVSMSAHPTFWWWRTRELPLALHVPFLCSSMPRWARQPPCYSCPARLGGAGVQ
jgi:hypothetical protein